MAQTKQSKRRVDGILVLDKPRGMTSNAALQKVRWLLAARKGGHTGSLDPLATGVLPLCFGEATKFSSHLLDADKSYLVEAQLGVTTSTGDAEGEVVERRAVNLGAADIEAVLSRFRGDIEQIPPMYSALKRDGQPLYKLARAGQVVEREPRSVTIGNLQLLELAGDRACFTVSCSKGTYIRTLVEDIGRVLGCGAHVSALRRTQAGAFIEQQAISLDTLLAGHEQGGSQALDVFLLPVDQGLAGWPQLQLSEHSAYYWRRGQPVRVPKAPSQGLIRVRDAHGQFLGIGEIDDDGQVAPRRLVCLE